MADRLATPEDLASFLERDDLDAYKAGLLVEAATAVVQAVVGQRIVRVTDDEVVIDLDGYSGGLYLDLPERPVTSVSTALIGSTAVTDYRLEASRGRLWRASGWRSTLLAYPGSEPSTATVTYTHGYATGDQGVQLARAAVLSLAAAVFVNPVGATQESLDDYSVTYEAMATRLEASPFMVGNLRRRYGRPTVGSVRLV